MKNDARNFVKNIFAYQSFSFKKNNRFISDLAKNRTNYFLSIAAKETQKIRVSHASSEYRDTK